MRFKAILPLAVLTVGVIVLGALAAQAAKTPATKPAEAAAAWKAMFPDGLIDAEAKAADASKLNGKIVGLYFSAHWCPPCKVFTPLLVDFRNKNAANFEVVFVSSDRSKEEHRKYLAEAQMPWLAVEWDSAPGKALQKQFDVKGIPTLVILGPDGKEITRTGRADVTNDANTALAKWRKAAK